MRQAVFSLIVILPIAASAQSEMSWRSVDWSNPRFAFPYEQGEIFRDKDNLYRIEETFQREVRPMGPVSPQAANFWRFCVISRFAASKGFAGWAFFDNPGAKQEATSSTMYFVLANSASDLPAPSASGFNANAGFQSMCSQFVRPEYHWWK